MSTPEQIDDCIKELRRWRAVRMSINAKRKNRGVTDQLDNGALDMAIGQLLEFHTIATQLLELAQYDKYLDQESERRPPSKE